jgi:DNA-binding CsgD family transcriptional regulator
MAGRAPSTLLGRHGECQALDRLLARARAGESRVLVLRGEAGVGKTVLLDYVARRASGCRVLAATGVESEMELAFAGLHQLCAPVLDRLDRLPGPQREALRIAFRLSTGPAPDRFLVGLAALSLLADLAEEQPLVCLIDDAQWLDRVSAQTMAFVARRLLAEPLAVVFAVREPSDENDLAGLEDLWVRGLSDDDARALLDSQLTGPLDRRVRDRIVAETRGNPLALLELPRGLTPAQLAGGFGLPDTLPLAGRIELGFSRRLETLPTETRRLLLVAAIEPVGDATLLWRAVERLGIAPHAAAAAEEAGLLDIGARVRFRHPVVRSAVCRMADVDELRAAHRALADVTDPDVDPDRRAWHRAHAAVGPDESIAGELEHAAAGVRGRGGIAAAAAFLERATALTPDPVRRSQRALDAAQAKLQAGALDPAMRLLAMAEAGPAHAVPRARLDLVRAHIAVASSRGSQAPPLLLAAARQLETVDVRLARQTYLDAFSAAMFAGRLAGETGLTQVAKAAGGAPPPPGPPRREDLLLDGLTTLFSDGYAAAVPAGRRALRAFRSDDLTVEEGLRWLWLASAAAADLWDDESWHVLAARHVEMARATGALTELPLALSSRISVHLFEGELGAAASLVEEARAVRTAMGSDIAPYGALNVAAWQGREADARTLIDATMREVVARGEGIAITVTQWANAVMLNALGRYEDALLAAAQAAEHPQELAAANWALAELVEAAARSGRSALAADALARLVEMTGASATDWALGVEARARALLSEGDGAESLYREAILRLGRTRMRVELARAHLLFGEWLRGEGRADQARTRLRTAFDMFTAMGAEGFAERARGELNATGESIRGPSAEAADDLTAQEAQIARLAAEGRTNPEIGAQLFISPRTVEYHLHKVYSKLDISSRKDLRGALADASRETAAA